MQRIHVLTTSGTIEKIYSEQTGSVENPDRKIETYLGGLRLPDTGGPGPQRPRTGQIRWLR